MNDINKENLKTIEKLRNDWEKKKNEAFRNYQDCGINRYYATYDKYQGFIKILDIAEKAIRQNENLFSKKITNIEHFISLLNKETYTKEEVKEFLNQTILF